MVSKLTKVTNEMGFHMRPANVFVTAMTKYASNINIIVGDKNRRSVFRSTLFPADRSLIRGKNRFFRCKIHWRRH